jgi:hypothetical protein
VLLELRVDWGFELANQVRINLRLAERRAWLLRHAGRDLHLVLVLHSRAQIQQVIGDIAVWRALEAQALKVRHHILAPAVVHHLTLFHDQDVVEQREHLRCREVATALCSVLAMFRCVQMISYVAALSRPVLISSIKLTYFIPVDALGLRANAEVRLIASSTIYTLSSFSYCSPWAPYLT